MKINFNLIIQIIIVLYIVLIKNINNLTINIIDEPLFKILFLILIIIIYKESPLVSLLLMGAFLMTYIMKLETLYKLNMINNIKEGLVNNDSDSNIDVENEIKELTKGLQGPAVADI